MSGASEFLRMAGEKPARPVKAANLARAWGVSRASVSRWVARGMPLSSMEAAEAWRAVNAPPRRRRSVEAEADRSAAANGVVPLVDVSRWVQVSEDFEGDQVKAAEKVAQLAYGLYQEAVERRAGPTEIQFALKNWHEASRRGAEVRREFMALQKERRDVIEVDFAREVVGRELSELRARMVSMGRRLGPDANPEDPALAAEIIDRDVDRIMTLMSAAEGVLEQEGEDGQ